MRHLRQYFAESGRWAIGSFVAAGVTFGIAFYEHFSDAPVSSFSFMAVTTCLVAAGGYSAWSNKRAALEKCESAQAAPKLYLGYVPDRGMGLIGSDKSGFFLRTEDSRLAANIKITSEETIAENSRRLGMLWEQPSGQIGNFETQVDVKCIYFRDGAPIPYGGSPRDQISTFFDQKKEKPMELIVTLEYTDIAGHPCPSRKFVVSKQGDDVADPLAMTRIDCQPLNTQIARL